MEILKRNLPIFLTGIAILVLFFIVIAFSQLKDAEPLNMRTVGGPELIAAHTYRRGNPDTPFSLVVFSDFSSEEDAQYQEILQKLSRNNSRYLNIALRHLPKTDKAFEMAKAAQVAGEQGKFWEYAEALYKRTLVQENEEWCREEAVEIARDLEMNIRDFRNDLDKEGFDSIIKTDIKHAELLGVTETPSFFLNNDQIGVENPNELEKKIQKEIDRMERSRTSTQNREFNYNTGNSSAQETDTSHDGILDSDQIRKIATIQEIYFTEEGWDPKEITVIKGQRVRWINNTEKEILLRQLDEKYPELENDIPIAPEESFEFRFTRPGTWRYREVNSEKWGSIFAENY